MAGEGYDVDELDAPKFVSRGEWAISGTYELERYTPLKNGGDLTSGAFGVSGIYEVVQWALPYDDISGMSGCIGITLRDIVKQTDESINKPFARRKMAVMHEGYTMMRYESGTLDGAVVTMKYGDKIAPTISGFRAWEFVTVEGGSPGTGVQQVELGWYADVTSDATGTRKRVKIMPNWVIGQIS